ncbi:hypothetical protein CEXT_285741 [Caerostris extrusa]|uniref:Uncharacterized protein n=1 Tax=Caerostris extrusa TaxID=172846 RepID=A0AAV4UZQ2_CAEEX|nr:hypothetical protein CEXT_285741 [Caerostris extrusa]
MENLLQQERNRMRNQTSGGISSPVGQMGWAFRLSSNTHREWKHRERITPSLPFHQTIASTQCTMPGLLEHEQKSESVVHEG